MSDTDHSRMIPLHIADQAVAACNAEIEHWKEQWHFVIQDNNKQMDEIAALKAEVERLRKAGDAMAEALNLNDDVFDNQDKREAQANWQAAKEGKPSV